MCLIRKPFVYICAKCDFRCCKLGEKWFIPWDEGIAYGLLIIFGAALFLRAGFMFADIAIGGKAFLIIATTLMISVFVLVALLMGIIVTNGTILLRNPSICAVGISTTIYVLMAIFVSAVRFDYISTQLAALCINIFDYLLLMFGIIAAGCCLCFITVCLPDLIKKAQTMLFSKQQECTEKRALDIAMEVFAGMAVWITLSFDLYSLAGCLLSNMDEQNSKILSSVAKFTCAILTCRLLGVCCDDSKTTLTTSIGLSACLIIGIPHWKSSME